MQKGRRGSWVEVDLGAVRENYRTAMTMLGGSAEAIAVVKSNAYVHGDAAVASALLSVGVRRFAVASLDEAVRLRELGFSKDTCDILILGYSAKRRQYSKRRWQYCATDDITCI